MGRVGRVSARMTRPAAEAGIARGELKPSDCTRNGKDVIQALESSNMLLSVNTLTREIASEEIRQENEDKVI